MIRPAHIVMAAIFAVFLPFQAFTQTASAPLSPSYNMLVSAADSASIIAHVRVRRAIELSPERAINVPQNRVRLYVEANVLGLIRGERGLPESIRYLVDLPRTDRGKAPKIKKQEYLIFANPGSQTGEVQLVGREPQIAWTNSLSERTRSIVRALVATDAPPRITGVREAFHVPGNLQGEGETQIFLTTKNGDPVSISVLRRPGLRPQWSVSLTEIVDAAARKPEAGTLLWYRLSCGLPPALPQTVLYSADEPANRIARADYQMILRELDDCPGENV